MTCYLCGNLQLKEVFTYDSPDKYLKTIGITESHRAWRHCPQCDLYQNSNGLTENSIRQVYLEYRNHQMRDATVKEEFDRINKIPFPESENKHRVMWLFQHIAHKRPKSMLDIGSGLGVFPYEMKRDIPTIYCIEPEPESAWFIQDELKIECFNGFYGKGLFPKVDLVTIVHVLEHMADPIRFLTDIIETDLKPHGTLFIEVPDAYEFDYLDKDHDEFNSLHLFFFNVSTLDRILRKAGFVLQIMQKIKYKGRNLSRIMMLCRR